VIALLRGLGSLGSLLLAFSFFLPPSYHNSPWARFQWAWREVISSEGQGAWHRPTFLGLAVVVAYPYLWAFLTTPAAWVRSKRAAGAQTLVQLGCHAVGLGLLGVFGFLLLLTGDTYVPKSAQVASVFVSVVLFSGVLFLRRMGSPRRSLCLVTAAGFFPHLFLQPILAVHVALDGGPAGGYALGTAGAFFGFGAMVCLFLIEGVSERNVHHNSDVQ